MTVWIGVREGDVRPRTRAQYDAMMKCRLELSEAMSDPVDPVGAYLALLARDRDARLRQVAAVRLAELRAETATWVAQLAALEEASA